ncbi:MAG: esterase/lipase family protein [Streptosporangiaceae bacterium]
MSQPLDPLGRPVPIGRIVLRTPGLAGVVDVAGPASLEGLRARQDLTPTLRDAFVEEGIEALETILIDGAVPVAAGSEVTRSTRAGEPAIELELPRLADGWEQIVLATDEAGVMTWHLAQTPPTGDVTGGQMFLVRATVPPSPTRDESPTRGLVGAIGRKVLQVLTFRAVEAAGGVLGPWVAGQWEAAKRPYRLRVFDPGTYRDAEAPILDNSWWTADGHKRQPALLMLHGTFSRTHSCFGELPRETVTRLHQIYAGKVAAFDHFTLSHDPVTNVEELVRRLPENIEAEVDIVAHSRGGLVARVLTESQGEISLGSRKLRVRKVIFVGTPNAGTILADAKHMGDLVDRYTNLLNLFPTNGITDILGAIIDTVKHLAVGATDHLTGLAAMQPGGAFLTQLNRMRHFADTLSYFTIASNYEPTHPGLRAYVRDAVMDRIFGMPNDLVVPEAGVHDLGTFGELPTSARLDLDTTQGVSHSAYFANTPTHQRILDWLSE